MALFTSTATAATLVWRSEDHPHTWSRSHLRVQDAASEEPHQARPVHATSAVRAKPATALCSCFGLKPASSAPKRKDVITFNAVDLSACIPAELWSQAPALHVPFRHDTAMMRRDPIHTNATTPTQVRSTPTCSSFGTIVGHAGVHCSIAGRRALASSCQSRTPMLCAQAFGRGVLSRARDCSGQIGTAQGAAQAWNAHCADCSCGQQCANHVCACRQSRSTHTVCCAPKPGPRCGRPECRSSEKVGSGRSRCVKACPWATRCGCFASASYRCHCSVIACRHNSMPHTAKLCLPGQVITTTARGVGTVLLS